MTAHPTRDELLCMAFVDDQLDDESRREFALRLAAEPELAREVTALQRLDLMARTAAPPEPIELAWQRIEAEPLQSAGVTLGWVATVAGAIGLLAIALVGFWDARIDLWQKLVVSLFLGGLTLVFLTVARRRWRSRPFDPYTAVKR
ncbi:MAG: hypothetical protein P1V81_02535 [Planctomycetota bacterium]|nr:hypothetical protein [Planctomycetota bacterium]